MKNLIQFLKCLRGFHRWKLVKKTDRVSRSECRCGKWSIEVILATTEPPTAK